MTDRIVWLTRSRPNSGRPEGMTSEAYGEATDRTANAADGWIPGSCSDGPRSTPLLSADPGLEQVCLSD